MHLVDFPSCFTRETTFVISYLLFCTPSPFWKGVYPKWKEFAPIESKFFHLRVVLFRREKKNNNILTELSPLKLFQFPLNTPVARKGLSSKIQSFSAGWISWALTHKAPRKSASENVVCLCRLLHLLANFSNLHFVYRQTVWTQIRLLLKEQSDLSPHCLQKWLLK